MKINPYYSKSEEMDTIDPGIRDLIYGLNHDLPFSMTCKPSCEGHLEQRLFESIYRKYGKPIPDSIQVAPDGYLYLRGGFMIVNLDGNELSDRFLDGMGQVKDRNRFGKMLVDRPLDGKGMRWPKGWIVTIGIELNDMERDGLLVESEAGKERFRYFSPLWNDLKDFVSSYAQRFK